MSDKTKSALKVQDEKVVELPELLKNALLEDHKQLGELQKQVQYLNALLEAQKAKIGSTVEAYLLGKGINPKVQWQLTQDLDIKYE